MASNRLIQSLTGFDPDQVSQIFGSELNLRPPDPGLELAPVKRVAIFAEAFLPKVDGVSKSAYLTLRHLQQTGREVLVFAPDIAPKWVGPSRIVPVPSLGLPFAPETRVALPLAPVTQYLDQFQPDLIHMFSPATLSISGMWQGRRRDIPVIANYQTDLPAYARHYGFPYMAPVIRRWLRYIHNGCHLTLVPSGTTMRQLRQEGYHRLRLWRRGVDGARFNPQRRSQAWRERLLDGRDPNSLLCVYVGRLATEKRVDLLRDVAKIPGVALTIVGDGAARHELEAMFRGTDTVFTGYLFGDDLAHAYASSDVFLFPGPSETFGQVVQEAMASGLPVVVTNQGSVGDLVKEGVNGFVRPGDARAFASAVRLLRENPALRTLMANNARQMAEEYPWEAIMSQLEGYYSEAIRLNHQYIKVYPHLPKRVWRWRIPMPLQSGR